MTGSVNELRFYFQSGNRKVSGEAEIRIAEQDDARFCYQLFGINVFFKHFFYILFSKVNNIIFKNIFRFLKCF